VEGCRFAVSAFTNLTQDHLDYHLTMENYYLAKKRLFDLSDAAVINIDDAYGERLAAEAPCGVKTFSTRLDAADFTAKCIELHADSSDFMFVGSGVISRVHIALPGEFSVSNAMAAIGVCLLLGFELEDVARELAKSRGVPGRFELLHTGRPCTIISDYANTPDAIEKVLAALRAVTKGRIVILFGSAGNRDRKKRPLMAKAAAANSDFVILTSDNPRREDPLQIIEDVKPGLLEYKTPFIVIADRYEAIRWAIDNAKPGDTLLLAGKGHEDYQGLAHGTIHFDDKEIVAELLAAKKYK
jgi:UDP-N-acetylmuramoyl-L-alanyl-D-glutamate--2,6-diaminopimelate ligase